MRKLNDKKRQAPSVQRRVSILAPHKKGNELNPNIIDAILAAAGAACSIALLQILADAISIPVYGSFLIGPALNFFLNIKPPSLKNFYQGTAFAFLAGTTLHFYQDAIGNYLNPFILFVCMIFFRLSGSIWNGAMALTAFYAVESGEWESFQDLPIRYLFLPWLSGHALLYASARAISIVRLRVRYFLFARQFILVKETLVDDVSGAKRDEKLRSMFNRMDTSGDGRLDFVELRIALRSLLGIEISLEDSQGILHMVDTDGDGTLDFEEFCAKFDELLFAS